MNKDKDFRISKIASRILCIMNKREISAGVSKRKIAAHFTLCISIFEPSIFVMQKKLYSNNGKPKIISLMRAQLSHNIINPFQDQDKEFLA